MVLPTSAETEHIFSVRNSGDSRALQYFSSPLHDPNDDKLSLRKDAHCVANTVSYCADGDDGRVG